MVFKNKGQLSNVNIYEIIPLLHAVQQAGETNESFSTIMIPFNKEDSKYSKKQTISTSNSISYNLNPSNDQYTITFGYKKFGSKIKPEEGYDYVEIKNISKENNSYRKNMQIKILSKSLRKIFSDSQPQYMQSDESQQNQCDDTQQNQFDNSSSTSLHSPNMVKKLRSRIVNSGMKNIIHNNRELEKLQTEKNTNQQMSAFNRSSSMSSFMYQNKKKKGTILLQQVALHNADQSAAELEDNSIFQQNKEDYQSFNQNVQTQSIPQHLQIDLQQNSSRFFFGNGDQSLYQNLGYGNNPYEESSSPHRCEMFSPQYATNNNVSVQNLLDASNQIQPSDAPSPKKIGYSNMAIHNTDQVNLRKQQIQKISPKTIPQQQENNAFFNLVRTLKKKREQEQSSSNTVSLQELSTNLNKQSSSGQDTESPSTTILRGSIKKLTKKSSSGNEKQNILQQTSYRNELLEPQDNCQYDDMSNKDAEEYESDINTHQVAGYGLQMNKIVQIQKLDDLEKEQNARNSDSEDLKEEDQKNEIASVNSSKFSQVELSKRIMISQIKSKRTSSSLIFMLYTGILSFIVLTFLTLILNNKGYESLMDYKKDFNRLDIAVGLLVDVLDLIKTRSFGDLAKRDVFFRGDEQFISEQLQISIDENVEQHNDYQTKLISLLKDINSPQQMDKLTRDFVNVKLFSQMYFQDGSYQLIETHVTQNLIDFILLYLESIYRYITLFAPEIENILWENINMFHDQMVELQKIIEDEVLASLDSIYDQQVYIIVTILIVSSILVLIVIPISVYVRMQKEIIYKLIGSFNPLHLSNQIDSIETVSNKLEAFIISLKSENNLKYHNPSLRLQKPTPKETHHFQEQIKDNIEDDQKSQINSAINSNKFSFISRVSNKRNRTIASFSSINKVNCFLLLAVFMIVSVIMIQPLLNYVILLPFLNESKIVLEERVLILEITSQLVRNQAPNYQNIWMFLYEETHPKETYYYEFIQNQTHINIQQKNKIQSIIKNAKVPRRQQSEYNNFYLQLMNGNLCEVQKKYQKYFNYTNQENECEELFSGIFKRGFLLAIQHSYQQFSLLEELYEFGYEECTAQFIALQKNQNFYDLHQSIKLLMKSVNAINHFQNALNEEYIQYIFSTLSILFIFQIFLVCILFILGWSFTFSIFNKELKEMIGFHFWSKWGAER